MASSRRTQEAQRLLRETFGFNEFRAGQFDIVNAVLQGRDVLAVLPTGGGKSLCFQVPALVFPACTLVVSPLVALMTDQVQRLRSLGIAAECIHGGRSFGDVNQILHDAHAGKLKLLYVAPERLESEQFRSQLSTVSLSLLAIDEAHCISEWGHDFRPAYRSIMQLFAQRQRIPIIALTATATPDVRTDIVRTLDLQNPTVIVRGFDRPNLRMQVETTPHKVEYITQLVKRAPTEAVLIYAGSRRRVDTLTEELRKRQIHVLGYHAGKPPGERSAVQQAFISGSTPVLVATNAFGMGIDKSNIRNVVHTDLTLTLEAYYQEAGRGGRDGEPATCTLLYVSEDKRLMDFFIECTFPEETQIREVLDYLSFRAQGTESHRPLMVDAATVAVDLHAPIARVQGVLGVLERHGALLRTSPSGSAYVSLRTTSTRLHEFSQQQPPQRKPTTEALARLLHGTGYEMGVSFDVHAFLRKHGLTAGEFQQTIRALLVQRLIQFREPEMGGGLVMLAEYASGAAVPVDMEEIHQRRHRAQEKLAAMIGYATTNACKRNYILGYFGDSEKSGTCGRCSSCTESSAAIKIADTDHADQLSIVRCVYELNGRFGKHVIADVVTATVSERVVNYRLDRATTWGILRARSREFVLRLIDVATNQDIVTRASGQFPTLAATPAGARFARPLPQRLDLTSSTVRSVDPGVYGAIVMLRDQLAEREHVAPTAMLSLSAVERLAQDKPVAIADLKPGDHGSGLFLARYGQEVVDTVQRAIRNTVRAIPKVRADEEVERAAHAVARCSSLADVARLLHVTQANAAQLVQRALEAGVDVEVQRIVSQSVLESVAEFLRNHRYAKLRHVREHVGEEVELPELRVAMAAARRGLYGVLP